MFSERSFFDPTPNRLSIARAKASGPLLDLTESNPTRAGIPYDESAILAALSQPGSLRYDPSPFGLPSAREAVAIEQSRGGRPIDPRRIVLTASTSEAYSYLLKLLTDPGDEVLVPRPSYPLLEHLARNECVRCVPYRLAYDGAWHLDLDSVRAAVSPRTRAIIAVHPNNPTGSYLTGDELAALGATGIPIVSDEVFAHYGLTDRGARALSALDAANAPLVFVLGGLSKLAALPQVKLAWIALGGQRGRVDDALARLELIADVFLSVGTGVQLAVADLLACSVIARQAIHARLVRNLVELRAAVRGSPASVLDLEGGWYATLRVPCTRSDEAWAITLVEEDSVYVHPGHFFDFAGEGYLVTSLLTPESTLTEGIGRIVARVSA
jgi:aspartate/methionine/tyrosine aminotransferase